MKIKLNFNYGYKWFHKNNIYVKGYLFDKNNKLFDKEKLIDYFCNIKSKNDFKNKLINANGIFSVIITTEDNIVLMAVDRTRTFPIFYTLNNNILYISDDTYYLRDKFKNKINVLSSQEYLAVGYVTGRETLLEYIYQVQSGEYIIFQDSVLKQDLYFDYIANGILNKKYKDLKYNFIKTMDSAILRLIQYADGNQIMLPLSGGYDSRLLACMLKKHNYKNVLCYTYGNLNSYEVEISKQVAKKLNFQWEFAEYTDKIISNKFSRTNDFIIFSKYSSNYSSKMVLMDYFAVKYLREHNIIDDKAIFVPGHSGDFLGGSKLEKYKLYNFKTLFNLIKSSYFYLDNNINIDIFNTKIEKRIKRYSNINQNSYHTAIEDYVLTERLSKHIVNSLRTYEYFNYKSYLPFFDIELLNFFKNLPIKYKIDSVLYRDVLFNDIFEEFNVNIKQPEYKDNLFKRIIRPLIPLYIRKLRSKRVFNNKNNVNLFSKVLLSELHEDIHVSKSNEIIAKWYINKIKGF